MRTPRIFINQDLEQILNSTQIIELPIDKSSHLVKVLKRKAESDIILFNGMLDSKNNYGEYLAEIINTKKNIVTAKILSYNPRQPKLKKNLELAQCISKSSHFDLTLQKSVELGVNIITPIVSQRSEQNIKQDNSEKKFSRWQKIINHACEQSGRCDVPVLNQPIDIADWISDSNTVTDNNLLLALCTKTNNSLNKINFNNSNIENIKIIIGPEGGLAETELNLLENNASDNKFNLVKLGNRIMRTETASIASLAIIQYLLGEM